jgi:hypothetical protein
MVQDKSFTTLLTCLSVSHISDPHHETRRPASEIQLVSIFGPTTILSLYKSYFGKRN